MYKLLLGQHNWNLTQTPGLSHLLKISRHLGLLNDFLNVFYKLPSLYVVEKYILSLVFFYYYIICLLSIFIYIAFNIFKL